ncbi:MAG: amidohydrolase family protein [Candidatus Brocadiia bacterium]
MTCDIHAHLHNEPDYADMLAETAQDLGFNKLCISGGESRYGMASNDQALDAAEKYPGLFVPFAQMRFGREQAVDVAEFKNRGFFGLRVSAPPEPVDSARFFPLYEAACALEMPVLIHTGFLPVTGLDKSFDVRCHRHRPVYLDTIARQFPALKIIGTSLGQPWYEEAAEVLRLHTNVCFDLSGSAIARKGVAFFRSLLGSDTNGVIGNYEEGTVWSQIVFGTGVHYGEIASVERDYQRLFRSLALSDETVEDIMGGNAERLVGVLDS